MNSDYLERILNARVYDVAQESPLEYAPNLSKRLDNKLLLKREDMQSVFSFKLRGAYNKMAQLPADFLKQGETPQNQFLKHPNFYQSLVLVDEPENNFTIEEFSLLAKKMKEHDGTLVFSTHHLDFLESFADEILVLRYGEFKGVYSKESFFNNDDPYIDYLSRMGC